MSQRAAELCAQLLAHQSANGGVSSIVTSASGSADAAYAPLLDSQYTAMQALAQRMTQLVGELIHADASAPRRP
jgi:hypothetical protein